MSASTFGLPSNVRDYLLDVGADEPAALAAIREATTEQLPDAAMMISSPEQASFIAWLLRLTGARRCLEVGTFTGYNALNMALAAGDGAEVICCDINDDFASVGKPHWHSSGVGDRIDLRIGPAAQTLADLITNGQAGSFDFAFIDADKLGYVGYYEQCLQLLRTGGIVAVDNVLWSGNVANPDDDRESTNAIRALNARVNQDSSAGIVSRVLLPVGDGLLLARKEPQR